MVLVPSGPQLLACSRSDSGVRRKGREREKNKEEKWERDLFTPTPPPFFFCSHLFALSPRSECLDLEQATQLCTKFSVRTMVGL